MIGTLPYRCFIDPDTTSEIVPYVGRRNKFQLIIVPVTFMFKSSRDVAFPPHKQTGLRIYK